MNPTNERSLSLMPDSLAAFCKAAGDELRLLILRVLSNDSFGVLELAHIFAMGQSSISHHLKVLATAGLVATRREGNAIFYRRALTVPQQPLFELHSALLQEIDALSIEQPLQQRIHAVHQHRAMTSQEFFAKVGQEFAGRQDLIASLPQFSDSLLTLLDTLSFPATAEVLEVGPGDGGLLPALAQRFHRVRAIDNSPPMLELAQSLCQAQQLKNVELILADALKDPIAPAHCVIVNMVLHHFAAPAEALKQLARLVKPQGSLIISELCSHDQDWAKQACGDLWLGFDQEELATWANAAGLIPSDSVYLGLKNGFQIQLRHFAKPDS